MSIPAFAAGFPARALSIASESSRFFSISRRASSRPPLAVVRAERGEVALPAPRADGLADLLPESDEPLVHVHPVLPRDNSGEGLLRLFRRLRPHEPEPVRNPVA